MKNYLKSIVLTFGTIIVISFIINLFFYYNLVNDLIYKILLMISIISIVGVFSFLLGKKREKKGYLEGLKYGLVVVFIMFLFSIILFKNIEINMLIYYPIIIITSLIFAVIGINYRKDN